MTRLADFSKFSATIFRSGEAKIFSDFRGYFENFLNKNFYGYFCKNLGYFLFQHLVTLRTIEIEFNSKFVHRRAHGQDGQNFSFFSIFTFFSFHGKFRHCQLRHDKKAFFGRPTNLSLSNTFPFPKRW